jgi:hypothetical protein
MATCYITYDMVENATHENKWIKFRNWILRPVASYRYLFIEESNQGKNVIKESNQMICDMEKTNEL